MKRILLSMMLGINLLLTGCWDRVEINDIALIEGIGFDKKANQWNISVQINIPKLSSGTQATGPVSGSAENFVTYGKANTLAEALLNLQSKLPRRVFWGHAKAVIFSQKVAEEGIRELVDFLARHPQPRPRAYMFVSEGDAKDVLQVHPPLERSTSEVLRELSKQKFSMDGITLLELVGALNSAPHHTAIPKIIISPLEEEPQLGKPVYMYKLALFKEDKMVGELDEKTSRGVLWIKNDLKEDIITVVPKESEGSVVFRQLRAKSKLIPQFNNGKWKMTIKIKAQFDSIENASRLKISESKILKVLEQQLEEVLTERINASVKVLQKKKIDILGFGKEFHKVYPDEWNKVKENWDEIFPNVEVAYDVKVTILRQGKTNSPQGVPEKEVIK